VERNIEREHVPAALHPGMGVCGWSPLASGFLAGKCRKGAAGGGEGSGRLQAVKGSGNPVFEKFTERNWKVLEALLDVAGQLGRTPAQVAVNWITRRPGVASTIVGGPPGSSSWRTTCRPWSSTSRPSCRAASRRRAGPRRSSPTCSSGRRCGPWCRGACRCGASRPGPGRSEALRRAWWRAAQPRHGVEVVAAASLGEEVDGQHQARQNEEPDAGGARPLAAREGRRQGDARPQERDLHGLVEAEAGHDPLHPRRLLGAEAGRAGGEAGLQGRHGLGRAIPPGRAGPRGGGGDGCAPGGGARRKPGAGARNRNRCCFACPLDGLLIPEGA